MLELRWTLLLTLVLTLLAGCSEPPADPAVEATDPPAVEATEAPAIEQAVDEAVEPRGPAAVATPDTQSAQVAADILAAGGNAVDASIAVGFALAVTEPEAGNIGGGGFMLIHIDGEAYFLDYRETAPLAAYRDMYLDENGEVIEGASRVGHLSVGVPGSVAGLWAAHERFGSLPWKDLVMPAVKLARDGFVIHDKLASMGENGVRKFDGKTNFADYFASMTAGEVFKQPELADALERIANEGRDGFYMGKTAELMAAEMERGGGLITREDLANYEAIWREPLRVDWRGFEILSAPPPSSGGFAIVQLLKIKDLLAAEFEGLGHNTPQYIHLIAEIQKRVFADRAEYLGDPDFVDVPMEQLLSAEYLVERAAEVDPVRITPVEDVLPGLDSFDTTHYSIVDGNGNAVSTTTTLNLSFGSGVVVEGAGFLLNDEMDDFSAKPGVPNAFGVVGSVANEIQPGKRMLSSMSPTILLKDGEVEMVVGTPGGSTIFTSVFQTMVNLLDHGKEPLDAVGSTRFHHQLLPANVIMYSRGVPLDDEVLAALAERGYRTVPRQFGDVMVIVRDGDGWAAAADPRNRGESRILE
ncbi:MAG: gamma-glutamyltransferase [Woeseiaceae bacterium]|nr:gamma-glutamyltransferase [Woeseiaceae bacterium]